MNSLVQAQNGWRKGEMEIKITIDSKEKASILKKLNLNGDFYPNNTACLYVTENELHKITAAGIDYTITVQDLDQRESFWATETGYHSYDEIITLMDSLETAFPDICKKYVVGTSVSGRELSYLKISDNVTTDESEPEVMFDAGIHGDEIGGPENAIRFARFLCAEYATNTNIADMINNREIFIYCMVNPDGRVANSRYNSNGVDLNRDWGYMWNGEGSSSGAYSQIESKALRDVMYNNQFVIHSTYHSGIVYISQPWSYRSSQPADHTHIDYLGGIYASSSGYTNIPHAQGNTGMYPINGSTKDCNYGINGSVSWSIEISEDKQPPALQINYYYSINEPAMLSLIEYAGYGINGTVTDANTGDPVQAVIYIDDLFPVFSDPSVGDFHKWVIPGTYNVKVVANGYDSKLVSDITVDADGTDMISIEMTPNTQENYIYKVVSSQIPDNNNADEGLTHKIIGPEDNAYYSIGKNGWVVFDMQESISDKQGNDIKIFEGDATPENYTLAASNDIDGPFYNIGTGSGTTEFDLANGNVLNARYFKITDDGDGSANVADAGFDFDAAQKLPGAAGPYILVQNKSISEVSGNGNGRIDPGETIDFTVNVLNNGNAVASDITATISCISEHVTLTTSSANLGSLNPGETGSATYTMNISEETPEATPFTLDLNIEANSGSYSNTLSYSYFIGLLVEDFETGGFTAYPWTFTGEANWQLITGSNVYEGIYSAQSGDIGDSQESVLEVEVNVPMSDEISFYVKVSCEDGSNDDWDYLVFLIDGIEQERWDGEVDWTEVTFPVNEGVHTFTWKYLKDYTVSNGSDCAWIDYIIMPGSGSSSNPLSVDATANPSTICSGETTQLIANASGGSENYTYTWTPGNVLNDPGIINPVATLTENTTFTVTVDDGINQTEATVSVTVQPTPETPIITEESGVLLSNTPIGNQWYNSTEPITGATEQTYTPTESGTYYTIVSVNNCASEPSNEISVAVGIGKIINNNYTIIPNPSNGKISITNNATDIRSVQLYSMEGVKIDEMNQIAESENISMDLLLKQGIYVIKIINQKNQTIVRKLIIQ
jgi:uncharacterized repeat protein (TIGR01451 family)